MNINLNFYNILLYHTYKVLDGKSYQLIYIDYCEKSLKNIIVL